MCERSDGKHQELPRGDVAAEAAEIMIVPRTLHFSLELPDGSGPNTSGDERELTARLVEALIMRLLPQLASEFGIEKHRLAGSLLVELGFVVGLSHTPAAAADALAIAAERMRDALGGRRDRRPTVPAPTVAGPTTLQ